MGIKKSVRRLPQWLLWRSGVNAALRRRLIHGGRIALVFHGVAAQRHSELGMAHPHHSAAELRQTLQWLSARFQFLTPAQFLEQATPGVLLTFDDGLNNNFEIALPILEAFNAPGLFFVTTQHVEQPSNWLAYYRKLAEKEWGAVERVPERLGRQFYDGVSAVRLREVARHPLVTIGAHTISHPFLTQCDDRQLAAELVEGRRHLQQLSGQPVDSFAYPTNDYDQRVAQAVKAAGFTAAFAVWSRRAQMPNYEIRRIGLYKSTPAYLDSKLNGVYQRPYFGPVLN